MKKKIKKKTITKKEAKNVAPELATQKNNKLIISKRIDVVMQCLIQGLNEGRILEYVNNFVDPKTKKVKHGWNVQKTNVRYYIKKAYQRFEKYNRPNQNGLIRRYELMMEKIIDDCFTIQDYKTALRAIESTIKLLGISRPTEPGATLPPEKEAQLNAIEEKLFAAASKGEQWAVMYLLNAKGKSRGYGANPVEEVEGKVYKPVFIDYQPNATTDTEADEEKEPEL